MISCAAFLQTLQIHMVQLEDDVLRRYRRSSPDEAHDNTVVGTAGYDADFGRYLVTNNLNQVRSVFIVV